MKLFVGLGNPGREYLLNRHNVGFMAVDAIAAAHDFPTWRKRFSGLCSEGKLGREQVLLLKPQTFMNQSGRSVGEAVRFYKLGLDDVVVFHDEIDLAPGKLRVKTGGGVAGHNGLKSITAHIGNDYWRVRIGIGHPGSKDVVVHHVLNNFAKSDREWLEPLLGAIAKAGSTALNEVYQYAEPVVAKGLVVMDTPGFDPVSVTGMVAGGANVVAFSTGRGSCYGCKPTPSIKIATNSRVFEQLPDDIDFNAGVILEGVPLEAVGRALFQEILAVASGKKTKSEQQGFGDEEFIPWQIGPVL